MVEPGRSAGAREAKNKTSSSSAGATMKGSTKKKAETKKQSRQCTEPESPSYRLALRSIFSCRNSTSAPDSSRSKNKQQLGCSSAPSICKVKDNDSSSSSRLPTSKQTDDEAAAGEPCKRRASVSGSERCVKKPLSEASSSNNKLHGVGSSSSSSSTTGGSSFRAGMQLRRLSGCYECHMVVDPIFRDSSSSSSMRICPCPDCGEIFVRQESLQLHQSIRHAVSELGSEDTSRNIIEIIFQSSWLKKQSPVCRIERILKVHNTARTLARFEEYRDAVKAKAASGGRRPAAAAYPRCTADGNELLRFHCATLACSLGINGATHLCDSSRCAACAIIRDGFRATNAADGIRTMATSGRAHDAVAAVEDEEEEERVRAMLVCRVIAGRVKRPQQQEEDEETSSAEEFESVAGSAGVYSNMEELQVFNPTAILPCFVVIYKA
ncbi:hypothetical protein EJB05_40277 [Eragrostis curvula]|uniref:C2H2-type domain-containing protein n=1 Tax=Eragrostis curvula TaxID=38414 RepID=A0A5J9TZ63_9POAL|nr:hypothetical protein EJB05_40277 [Eragrostis curvula]